MENKFLEPTTEKKYKFAKPNTEHKDRYMILALKKSGIERELFGKPLLIIGDKTATQLNSEDRNISAQIEYPTFSLVDHVTHVAITDIGTFEFSGNVSKNGETLSMYEIGRGDIDVFSAKYTDFVEKNPELAAIYEIQKGSEHNTFPFEIARMNDRKIGESFGTSNEQLLRRMRKSALNLRRISINSLFNGLIVNGNDDGIEQREFEIIEMFRNATIPARFIASSICPIADIYKQKTVLMAQRICEALKANSESKYTPYISKLGAGRCRVISLVTKKPRT